VKEKLINHKFGKGSLQPKKEVGYQYL